jgi:hypothetical protein
MIIMTASFCGKPPNFPWRGSVSQWDQERSDQIRVGEAICPGFEALNPVKIPLFYTEADRARVSKWLADKKAKDKPKVEKKVKAALEYIDASKLGLADFM